MRTVVSLVSYSILPASIGGQKAIAIFHKYLGRKVKLICVSVRKNDPAKAEGYEMRNILSDSSLRYINPFYFFTIRRILKQTGASVLLLEQPYYGWLGTLLKWFTGVKLVVRSHNIESERFRSIGKWWWRIMRWYEGFTHRRADINIFIQHADRAFAIKNFALDPARCITISYGVEWQEPPSALQRSSAAQQLRAQYHIAAEEKILLFNGAFNYRPNLEALKRIIDTIHPWLKRQTGFRHRIIVCGRDIPLNIVNNGDPQLIIAGFVDDIGLYFKGADVFMNPIIGGGGIKTKLVEALGYNLNAVSTENGAIGVDPEVCNGKLLVAPDGDWDSFCKNILAASAMQADIPQAFFRHFDWSTSIEKLEKLL